MDSTHIIVGTNKKAHRPCTKTKPKCATWVMEKAEASRIDARDSPQDFLKLLCTIPLKNNSSPIGLKIMAVPAMIKNKVLFASDVKSGSIL